MALRVLHLSTSDDGGAGRACVRLHTALLQIIMKLTPNVICLHWIKQITLRIHNFTKCNIQKSVISACAQDFNKQYITTYTTLIKSTKKIYTTSIIKNIYTTNKVSYVA